MSNYRRAKGSYLNRPACATSAQGTSCTPYKAWYCKIEFSLQDWFKDPGDIMDKYPGEIEWMDCTPYKIVAYFSFGDIGKVFGR